MDTVIQQIYQLVVPSLPYVLGAYGVLWLGLMIYVAAVMSRVGKLERQLALVEEAFSKRG